MIFIKKVIKELIPYIVIVIVVVLIRSFIATPVRVDGDSMNKTFKNGDILILYKLSKIKRFDVIVLHETDDDEKIIKRVIGMPGDTVAIKDGEIYINDKKIEDKYAYGMTSDYDRITLKSNEYFILGDNRLISKDSRYFGPIKEKEIKGKVVFRLFPFSKFGKI